MYFCFTYWLFSFYNFMKLWIIVLLLQEGELRLCASLTEGRVSGDVDPGSGSELDLWEKNRIQPSKKPDPTVKKKPDPTVNN